MATWDEVRRVACGLAEVTEQDGPQWRVAGRTFTWNRPFSKADLKRFRDDPTLLDPLGGEVPEEPILAVSTVDEGAKHALVAAEPAVFFTIAHFDGYAAVLVRLPMLRPADLPELLTEAWLARAPARLTRDWLPPDRLG